MTLYEELGISPDASADEIRRAYRTLARLLHPDQQDDETLRRLAEGRMKRLNSAHAILADPVRRQEYDATAALSVVPCPKGGRLSGRDVVWFLAGLAVATLYWRLSPAVAPIPKSNSEPVAQARSVPLPGTHAAASKRPAGASAVPAPARPEPGKVRMEFARPPEPSFPSEPAALSPPALAATPAVPAVRQLAPAEPPAAPPPAASRFRGTWIYVPPRVAASEKALYPPEYIETVILEGSGEIRGRYRARYRIPDRPISSEVAFRFVGRAEGDAADLIWNGTGGSEGEVKLVLLSAHTMRVDWMATSLGTQLGLASGTAVLTRRQEP